MTNSGKILEGIYTVEMCADQEDAIIAIRMIRESCKVYRVTIGDFPSVMKRVFSLCKKFEIPL